MECAEIRSHLSEYLDDALDAQTRTLVEKHLLKCKGCNKAFESLQSLILELGDLDHIKAPQDFLAQLNDRMEKGFRPRKLTRKLFVPFKIKIPLQFATAVAMAILIFSIIHTPEMEKEIAGIPKTEKISECVKESEAKDVFREKQKKEIPAPAAGIIQPVAPHPEEQLAGPPREAAPVKTASRSKKTTAVPLSQEKPYLRKPADEKAEAEPSVKESAKPVELALLLKPDISKLEDTSPHDLEKRAFLSSEKGKTGDFRNSDSCESARTSPSRTIKIDRIEEDQAIGYLAEHQLKSKEEPVSEVLSSDEALSRIRDIIDNIKGTVLSTEYDKNTSQPKSLYAEIPAGQYGFFCEKLQELGTFQPPIPAIDLTGLKSIKIRIRFIHS